MPWRLEVVEATTTLRIHQVGAMPAPRARPGPLVLLGTAALVAAVERRPRGVLPPRAIRAKLCLRLRGACHRLQLSAALGAVAASVMEHPLSQAGLGGRQGVLGEQDTMTAEGGAVATLAVAVARVESLPTHLEVVAAVARATSIPPFPCRSAASQPPAEAQQVSPVLPAA